VRQGCARGHAGRIGCPEQGLRKVWKSTIFDDVPEHRTLFPRKHRLLRASVFPIPPRKTHRCYALRAPCSSESGAQRTEALRRLEPPNADVRMELIDCILDCFLAMIDTGCDPFSLRWRAGVSHTKFCHACRFFAAVQNPAMMMRIVLCFVALATVVNAGDYRKLRSASERRVPKEILAFNPRASPPLIEGTGDWGLPLPKEFDWGKLDGPGGETSMLQPSWWVGHAPCKHAWSRMHGTHGASTSIQPPLPHFSCLLMHHRNQHIPQASGSVRGEGGRSCGRSCMLLPCVCMHAADAAAMLQPSY
jgi:hypothetical protein